MTNPGETVLEAAAYAAHLRFWLRTYGDDERPMAERIARETWRGEAKTARITEQKDALAAYVAARPRTQGELPDTTKAIVRNAAAFVERYMPNARALQQSGQSDRTTDASAVEHPSSEPKERAQGEAAEIVEQLCEFGGWYAEIVAPFIEAAAEEALVLREDCDRANRMILGLVPKLELAESELAALREVHAGICSALIHAGIPSFGTAEEGIAALRERLKEADAVITQINGYPEWWWNKPQEREWIREARERHATRQSPAAREG